MTTDQPDPRIRAALTLVDSPYLSRDDAGLSDDERTALDVIARIMGEYHALAPPAPGRGEPVFRWGPLDVHEEIGRGSFGVVYFARDRGLDLDVALKLQPLDDDGDAHAIMAEARRLARVRHVNVCTVLGVNVHDGQVGLWTDHVPGRTLADRLSDGTLSVPETIRVGVQLARALQAVHAADLVHGDLTASNVVEGSDGRIVLTDFGSSIVRAAGHGATIPRTGTPLAMAPELFTNGTLSASSDIYALGALLFQLLTGEHLVAARNVDAIARAHRLGERRSLTAHRDDVPSPLEGVIVRATATLPEDRYPTALKMEEALATSGIPLHNLPVATTSFVGRDEDVSVTRAALSSGRMVTLTGVGGVGKTRLAIEVARNELPTHPDGVWLVELDDVPGPDGVPAAVAHACGIHEPETVTAESVAAALGARRLLLILDNCERESSAVAELVAAIIASTASVTVLCTSRVLLGVPGEVELSIAPLPVDLDQSEPGGAVRLFLDRWSLRSSPPDGHKWIDTVSRICRHVDGIPLALELAAARASTLDLEELERRLAKHLAILATHRGSRPERHRTMNALVEWSVDLLDDECAMALRVLGIFPGSFTLGAAEAILAAAEPRVSDPMAALIRLVDDSLVERLGGRSEESPARYCLLVPVREFAVAALEGHEQYPRVRDSFHAHYVQHVLEVCGERTPGPAGQSPDFRRRAAVLEAIHADYHNIRAAVRAHLDDPSRREMAGKLVIALFDYSYDRGSRHDAEEALRRLVDDVEVEGTPPEATPMLARLYYLWGVITWTSGDAVRSQLAFERARSHYQKLGLALEESKAVSALGLVVGKRAGLDKDHAGIDRAVALVEESVSGYQNAGEIGLEAEAYSNLGTVFMSAGLHDRARACYESACRLVRGTQFHRVLSGTLCNLARVCELEGDDSAAVTHLGEAGEAARAGSDPRTVAYCDFLRGRVLARAGDTEAAIPVLEEAIRVARRTQNERVVAYAHLPLARCHTLLGDCARALESVEICIRFVDRHRFRGREELIPFAVLEAGYVAVILESWRAAAWMLGWSADRLEQVGRAGNPRERERLQRVMAGLNGSIGPTWREDARGLHPVSEADALVRALNELEDLAARTRG